MARTAGACYVLEGAASAYGAIHVVGQVTVPGDAVVCGGLCYLILLVPPLAGYLSPWYLAPDVIAEPVLMLWLLIVGLNPDRWLQQAGQAEHATGVAG